jgi:hypothetical protein
VTGGKPIAVYMQPISGGDYINPLVAFYDIHGRKREVLFFCSVSETTRVNLHYANISPTRRICRRGTTSHENKQIFVRTG